MDSFLQALKNNKVRLSSFLQSRKILIFAGLPVITIILLLTIGMFLANQSRKPTQEVLPDQSNTPLEPSPQETNTVLKTFTNTKYGYSVEYPASWFSREFNTRNDVSKQGLFDAFFVDSSVPFDSYPQSLVDVSILVYDKWNDAIQKALEVKPGQAMDKTTIAGFDAVRVNETDTTYIFKSGYIYVLHAAIRSSPNPANIKAIRDIVDSFSFTDGNQEVITAYWNTISALDSAGKSIQTVQYKLPPSINPPSIGNAGSFKYQTSVLSGNTALAVLAIGQSFGYKLNPDDFVNQVVAKNNYTSKETTVQGHQATDVSGILTNRGQSTDLNLNAQGSGVFRAIIVKLDDTSGFELVHYQDKNKRHSANQEVDFAADDSLVDLILTTFNFNAQPPAANIDPPDKVALSFYTEYMDCWKKYQQGGATGDPAIACMEIVKQYKSSTFDQHVRQREFNGIMCAQNFPLTVSAEPPVITDNAATVLVHHIYESSDNPITLTFILDSNQWKIDNILCQK